MRSLFILSGKTLFPNKVRYGCIVKGLPVKNGLANAVYCSHVLEHIDRTSIEKALENTYKMLRPGGVFRLVVPDLAWRTKEFVAANQDGNVSAADEFMRKCHLGQIRPAKGIISRARQLFGNSDHRWMYDEAAMTALLIKAGFAEVRRCRFGDAEDQSFVLVEDEGRFLDCGNFELAIEAKRPM